MSFEITFFGTNNHNFGSSGSNALNHINTPIGFDAAGMAHLNEDVDTAPVNHTLNNSTEVANFEVDNGTIGGDKTHGIAKVTIKQTSDFVGRKLYLQYFRKNGDSWTKSGPHIEINGDGDGDALDGGDVTALAASGMGIATQTGIMIRAYYTGPEIPLPAPTKAVVFGAGHQSNEYINVTHFNPHWYQNTYVNGKARGDGTGVVQNNSNDANLTYTNLNYQGINFDNIDVTGYTHLHVEYQNGGASYNRLSLISQWYPTNKENPVTLDAHNDFDTCLLYTSPSPRD